MKRISFEGQVAIVTGAGRGIGRAYAMELARRGASVVVNDIGGVGKQEGSWADVVVEQIQAEGGKAAASHHSVSTPEGGQGITDMALSEFGGVDIVINNAGFLRRAMFETMPLEYVKEVLDVHLLGAFYVTQPAWKVMAARRYGRVLFTSSAAAFGMQGNSNYCAAKAGLLGLANALSKEGEDLNIRVNAILPYARTMITVDSPAIGAEAIHNVAMQKELGPRMTTDSVVAAAVFLASKQCVLNGQAISALAGRYARTSLVLTQGWLRKDVEGVTVEDFQENLDKVIEPGTRTEASSLGAELEDVIMRIRALDA
ncbi:MAG: SDR family NAD(P)-dependent oxidoreductase [Burkholderiaceae bacterium]|nr:SDR family NAD(P)-dependent oxidoreductase [Burkholderiaceae bacterium]